jgi:hypothetical protein
MNRIALARSRYQFRSNLDEVTSVLWVMLDWFPQYSEGGVCIADGISVEQLYRHAQAEEQCSGQVFSSYWWYDG